MGRLSPLHAAVALAFAGLVASHSQVEAQSCAMLPPAVPSESSPASPQARQAAADAVREQLVAAHFTVLSSSDAQRRMVGEIFQECAQLDCGNSVVRSLGVDFAVLVTVWAPGGAPTAVTVALVTLDDSYGGESTVAEGNVTAAAERALSEAQQRLEAAQMGFLEISSLPTGAEVEIDARPVGTTPIRRLVMRGQRTVRVSLDGYVTVEQTVDVAPAQVVPVELALASSDSLEDPGPAEPVWVTEAHWANFLVGGLLLAGGAVAAIQPINTLANLDSCVDPPGGALCRRVGSFGPISGTLTGVALAALTAGVLMMALQPITVQVEVSPTSAGARLSATF